MDFDIPEELLELKALVREFVQRYLMPLEPTVIRREAERGLSDDPVIPPDIHADLLAKAKELGLWGLDVPKEYGGHGLGALARCLVAEELSQTIVPFIFPPDSPNLEMLIEACNEEQKEKYLIPYARGEKKSAICISEPWAGSDPRSMRTRAVKKGDRWIINGRKQWISRAKEADFLIVMAYTDPNDPRNSITAFLVDRDTPGVTIARSIPTIGHSQPYEVVFDNVEVPESQVLGEVGKGFAPMQTRLNTRRVQMGGRAIGTATRALRMMIEHANQRVTFGRPLAERQAVQFMIADSAMEIEAVRWLTYRTAWKVDQGEASLTDAAMVKVMASEMVGRVLDRAIQVHGGMGVSKDLPLEFMYRQARIDRIVEGPSEIHRWAIARDYLKGYRTP